MKKIFPFFFFLCVPVLFSCAKKPNAAYVPSPDQEYFNQERINIDTDKITESKDGDLPAWLASYISGGIEEVEKRNTYYGKYVFIGMNEGINFRALDIWANYLSEVKDFTMLAAKRIERRMISTSSMYPDDEYGIFYETMVKKAYSAEYPGAVKEDFCWIKITDDAANDAGTYNFFVLFTIDKMRMQSIVLGMMADTVDSVEPSRAQLTKINNLRQTFFWGF